jgi:hypothetical protein
MSLHYKKQDKECQPKTHTFTEINRRSYSYKSVATDTLTLRVSASDMADTLTVCVVPILVVPYKNVGADTLTE